MSLASLDKTQTREPYLNYLPITSEGDDQCYNINSVIGCDTNNVHVSPSSNYSTFGRNSTMSGRIKNGDSSLQTPVLGPPQDEVEWYSHLGTLPCHHDTQYNQKYIYVSTLSVVWISCCVATTVLLNCCLVSKNWMSSPEQYGRRSDGSIDPHVTPYFHKAGPWRVCTCYDLLVVSIEECDVILGRLDPEVIPVAWTISGVLFLMSAILSVSGVVSAMGSICFHSCLCENRSIFAVTGAIYGFVGLFMVAGFIAFSAGWSHPSIQAATFCGLHSFVFMSGNCHLNWSFYLALTTLACCVFVALAAPFVEKSINPVPLAFSTNICNHEPSSPASETCCCCCCCHSVCYSNCPAAFTNLDPGQLCPALSCWQWSCCFCWGPKQKLMTFPTSEELRMFYNPDSYVCPYNSNNVCTTTNAASTASTSAECYKSRDGDISDINTSESKTATGRGSVDGFSDQITNTSPRSRGSSTAGNGNGKAGRKAPEINSQKSSVKTIASETKSLTGGTSLNCPPVLPHPNVADDNDDNLIKYRMSSNVNLHQQRLC